MILVAVDDLLFSSKIRATARQTGVDLVFARTPDDILTQARQGRPTFAIFDPNCEKTDPVATIAAIKRDPVLASLRVIGFVSHVHTALIDAARKAGADEVMPRSAFAARLHEILQPAGTPQP